MRMQKYALDCKQQRGIVRANRQVRNLNSYAFLNDDWCEDLEGCLLQADFVPWQMKNFPAMQLCTLGVGEAAKS